MFFCTTLISDSLQDNTSQNGKAPIVIEEVYQSGAIKINNAEGTNPKVVNGQQIKHYLRYTH